MALHVKWHNVAIIGGVTATGSLLWAGIISLGHLLLG